MCNSSTSTFFKSMSIGKCRSGNVISKDLYCFFSSFSGREIVMCLACSVSSETLGIRSSAVSSASVTSISKPSFSQKICWIFKSLSKRPSTPSIFKSAKVSETLLSKRAEPLSVLERKNRARLSRRKKRAIKLSGIVTK